MSVRILTGDCRSVIAGLPDQSIQCVVTSPPYYGLRDYGVDGQIGLESSPDEYVAEMIDVFRAVRRVLREDGTVWLNLGDSYATGTTSPRKPTTTQGPDVPASWSGRSQPERLGTPHGYKAKDLLMMPETVAMALRADGWYLRSKIVWHKPNPMPESATDRPTSSHELIFLLTKRPRYFYDADAVREGRTSDEDVNTFRGGAYVGGNTDNSALGKRVVIGNKRVKVPGGWDRGEGAHGTIHRDGRTSAEYQEAEVKAGRNMRNVWTIATAPFPEAHFATFPPELAERCIRAGTSERGCCPRCGSPWKRIIAKGEPDLEWQRRCGGDEVGEYHGTSTKDHTEAGVQDASSVKARILAGLGAKVTTGWEPTCSCPKHLPVPCNVLDPFGGAGTVGLVADRMRRDAVLIELNPAYADMARRRITADSPLFADLGAPPMAEAV